MKIINTPELQRLAAAAVQTDRNRQLDPVVLEQLDPDGFHIISQFLLHNDQEWRCRVFVKLVDRADPYEGWLDVSFEDWQAVERLDAVLAAAFKAAGVRQN
jgi:hypothetical protein